MKEMPGVGLGILIFNEQNEVLLLLRNDDANKALSDMRLEGTWTLPAGKVKYGETLIEAAIRKAKQETNLDIDDLDVVSIADDINEYAHFVTIGILAGKFSGEINLGSTEEQVAYQFFSLEELPENLCIPSKTIIENYLNKRIYQNKVRKRTIGGDK